MLKIKNHLIKQHGGFPIFCNTEIFLHKLEDIQNKISQDSVLYMGSMVKRRIKDFIIDKIEGYVYSLAITICETNNIKQYQLEIEYYGHLENFIKEKSIDEENILNKLVELTSLIYKADPEFLRISEERKFEFVLKNKTNESNLDNKQQILNNLMKV